MWVCGAHGDNNRESGIIEELQLENFYRNSQLSYPLWDSVLYEKAYLQPGVTLLLNCTCQQAAMDNGRIRSVRGWQMTSETYHTVEAAYFADCSGDSILAPLTGCGIPHWAGSAYGIWGVDCSGAGGPLYNGQQLSVPDPGN